MFRGRIALLVALALGFAAEGSAEPATPQVTAIKTSKAARAEYLAQAVIWHDPGPLSPSDLLDGPGGAFPLTLAQANPPGGIPCTFKKAGKELGGASPKFACELEGGETITVKYWDPVLGDGSREVFAAVAASRLLSALGFGAQAVLPISLRCVDCPQDPVEGTGARSTRVYAALLAQAGFKPPIISGDERDEGWSWADLDKAIDALPPGPERARQRMHFDALTLLGVLVQHGDRKPEQQVLYCDELGDAAVATANAAAQGGESTAIEETPGTRACARPAVALYDVGATFGGAGLATKSSTAKMNLQHWREKTVFKDENGVCRGNLTVSLAAGEKGEADPPIHEEGRVFLLQQLHRLTPEHLRAIFTAARVQLLDAPLSKRDDKSAPADADIEEWIAAFQAKVHEMEARRCPPAS